MKSEKVVLSFIAVIIGILVAAGAFYLYQATKTIPDSETKTVSLLTPTPKPLESTIFLRVESPKDEEVVDRQTITVSGKTVENAVVVVSTESSDIALHPAKNGNFSTAVTIDSGVNQLIVTAIAPNGEIAKVTRTVTFSTESF